MSHLLSSYLISSPLWSTAHVYCRIHFRDYHSCEHALIFQHYRRFNIHHKLYTLASLVYYTGYWLLGECLIQVLKCPRLLWCCTSDQEEHWTLSAFLLQLHFVTCFHIKDNVVTAFKANVCCLQPGRSILPHHYRYRSGLSLLSVITKKCSGVAKRPTCPLFSNQIQPKTKSLIWRNSFISFTNHEHEFN